MPATLDGDLRAALRDLDGAAAEAAASAYPAPTAAALDAAKLLLPALHAAAPRRFEVYPAHDGEIAIDTPSGNSSLLLLCDSGGEVTCLLNAAGAQRLTRHASASEVSHGVLRGTG